MNLMEEIVQGGPATILSFISFFPVLRKWEKFPNFFLFHLSPTPPPPPPREGGLGQKLEKKKVYSVFWDIWFMWSECTFLIETPYCDIIDLCEVCVWTQLKDTCIIWMLCHHLQSEPSIWSHISPLNQWEGSTWWKQLSKAPTPLFSVSCQETGIIPRFWKT